MFHMYHPLTTLMSQNFSKRKARRLTPPSDDDGIVIPEDPHASPPPSQVQPIVRQAVGFGSSLESAATIPMYKATVAEQSGDRYLLGMVIGQPQSFAPLNDFHDLENPAQPMQDLQFRFSAYQPSVQGASSSGVAGPSKGKGKLKGSAGRKKKGDEPFAGQVDKFRVSYNMGFTLPSSMGHGKGGSSSPHFTSDTLDTDSTMTSPHPSVPNVVRDYSRFFSSPAPVGSSYSPEPAAATPSKGKGKARAESKSKSKTSNRTTSKSTTKNGTTLSARQLEKQPMRGEVPSRPSSGDHSKPDSITMSARQLEKQPMRGEVASPAPSHDQSKTDYTKYYRYDYDRQKLITPDYRPAPPSEHGSQVSPQIHSPVPGSNGYGYAPPVPAGSSVASSRPSTASGDVMPSSGETERRGSVSSRPGYTRPRLVTLLIDDLRSGKLDKQIAEVHVPLKRHEDPDSGYWADAKDVAEQLQAGPSRIDGPARVFALRGEYRHFFLRVSEENVDTINISKAHLAVEKQLSMNVYVETLPGSSVQIPPRPRLPQEITLAEDLASIANYDAQSAYTAVGSIANSILPPKRRRGTANGSYNTSGQQQHQAIAYGPSGSGAQIDGRPPSPNLYQSSLSGTPSKKPKTSGYQGAQPSSSHVQGPSSSRQSAGSAQSAADRDRITQAIADWVKPHIEEHPDWEDYMKSKAIATCVSTVYRQFKFVQGRIDFWHGATTPPDLPVAPKAKIGPTHVLRAMKLTTDWGAQCSEAMRFIGYYGPDGTRYIDSRVGDLLGEHPRNGPLPQGDAVKRLLHLLREIHNDWTTEHPEDAE
ncbi:hypothetical protein OE88DRAFT_1140833 [Heliocybe sulcata]|uniref:Uncharacterized protein n=1 Tax=Heliocybe sulcata TaxID=5364 RepID=A0A5C3NC59_9AGAM|nr:hypothetical protein OE88DRAFT_1140833 [Heliocybe sulcata]